MASISPSFPFLRFGRKSRLSRLVRAVITVPQTVDTGFSEFCGLASKVKAPAGPGLVTVPPWTAGGAFLLCPHLAERGRSSLGVSLQGPHPIQQAPLSWPSHPQRPRLLMPSPGGPRPQSADLRAHRHAGRGLGQSEELTALTLSLGDNPGPAEQAQLTDKPGPCSGLSPGRAGRAERPQGAVGLRPLSRATLHVCSPA